MPQIYAIYTAELYPARTANPGERVIYTNGANAIQQKNQENVFAIQYCAHHNKNHMDRAVIDRFYICLGDYHQDLRDQTATMANPTFLEVCAKAVAMWGHTTPSSRQANLDTLKNPWHATEGMAKLWRNIKDTVSFTVAANAPIDPNLIVDAALIAINRTQAYK